MIVLSVGMPRAGTAWHYNLIHDLLEAAGAHDTRQIRERYHLQNILTGDLCNIGVLSARRLSMVTLPALMGNSFVIRAHAGPTSSSRLLQRLGLLRISYIYRDPRDAMLSAFEHGQSGLQSGRPNAFSYLTDFQKSLDFIMDYVRIWEKWIREKDVLVDRYEDLVKNYDNEITRLVGFLGLDGNRPEVRALIEKNRPGTSEGDRIGHFRISYSVEQQAILRDKIGSYLLRMGYQI